MSRGTALITGASSGIGEAFARLFAAEGFDLVLTARREGKLQELAADLATTANIVVLPGDLSTTRGITTFCESVSGQSLEIDVLVNNAGMMVEQEFADLTTEQIERTITLNITAVTQLIHQFLPEMKARKSGRILNVASVAAFQPVPGMDIYAATKAYVLSYTRALHSELKKSGVSVTALCPGFVETGFQEVAGMDLGALELSGAVPAEKVAKTAVKAMRKGRREVIPGLLNKPIPYANRLIPISLNLAVVKRLMS